jgi:uncharacterized protein with von Willebrand factor type A (vWA) domain
MINCFFFKKKWSNKKYSNDKKRGEHFPEAPRSIQSLIYIKKRAKHLPYIQI